MSDLEFLEHAEEAAPAAREALWRKQSVGAPKDDEAALRLALLQSLPAHSGSDAAAAQRTLRALLLKDPPEHMAIAARLRLAEMGGESACQAENQDLKRRVAQVVEIEHDSVRHTRGMP